MSYLGQMQVSVRQIPYGKSGFDSKIVYGGLESQLAAKGVRLRSVETRQNGPGTTLASRVATTGSLAGPVMIDVGVELAPNTHEKFSSKLVLHGSIEQLAGAGLVVHDVESSRLGRGEPAAIRVSPY